MKAEIYDYWYREDVDLFTNWRVKYYTVMFSKSLLLYYIYIYLNMLNMSPIFFFCFFLFNGFDM